MGLIVRVEVVLPEKKILEPAFECACGTMAASRMCSVGVHKGRLFYRCSNGWVDSVGTDEEDPTCTKHLMCDVWIWQDVISRFADKVFEVNKMNEEELEAEIVAAEGTGITY